MIGRTEEGMTIVSIKKDERERSLDKAGKGFL